MQTTSTARLALLGATCLTRKQVKLATRLATLDPTEELEDTELQELEEKNGLHALNVSLHASVLRSLAAEQN